MEDTTKVNFDKICRTCLLESPMMVSLTTKMVNGNRTLYDVLRFVLNNNITAGSRLPKQICTECELLLCKVDEFKTRCYDSERVIKAMLDSTESGPNLSVKLESSTKLDEKSSVERFFELTPTSMIESVSTDAKIEKFENENNESKIGLKEAIKEEFSDGFSDNLDDFFEDDDQNMSENNDSNTCLCGKVFTDFNQYQAHIDSKMCPKSNKNGLLSIPVKCEECNVVFKNTKAFKIHVKVHSSEKRYRCTHCSKRFRKKSSFLTHIDSKTCSKPAKSNVKKKPAPKDWFLSTKCDRCGSVYESMKLFKAHACFNFSNDKTQEYFQCSLCMRKFKKKSSLVTHLKNHEEKDNLKYTCDICKREFKYQAHLDNHNNLEHNTKKTIIPLILPLDENSSDKKHRCNICSKSFTMLSTLTDHMRTHTGERPFLCSICGRGFTQKTNLAQHMRRHLGLKPFKCGECERMFVSKGELDAHTRKHSGAHPFVCDECGNGFTTSSSLRKHKRVHTGERPYACDLCPMKFAASGTLKSHRRTHTGEKPYQCSYCEKAFVQRQDLVSHIRCHTGERPFVCAHCGQAFRKPSALKAHAKTHRPGVMGMQPMQVMQGMQNS